MIAFTPGAGLTAAAWVAAPLQPVRVAWEVHGTLFPERDHSFGSSSMRRRLVEQAVARMTSESFPATPAA
jgi:hypothetical protein